MPVIVGTFKGKELVEALKNAPVGSTACSSDKAYATIYKKDAAGYWEGRAYKYAPINFLHSATSFIVSHPYTIAEELE